MGYDLELTRAGLEPTARVLDAVRDRGFTVIHTREGHRPDLADCPPNKLWRSQAIGAGIGDAGPCGPDPGPRRAGLGDRARGRADRGRARHRQAGKGAFYATDLDLLLRTHGITHIILTGITTDVCVHTTMRDANDRGYECLLLSDCTGATDYGNYLAALQDGHDAGRRVRCACPVRGSAARAGTARTLRQGRLNSESQPARLRITSANASGCVRWTAWLASAISRTWYPNRPASRRTES